MQYAIRYQLKLIHNKGFLLVESLLALFLLMTSISGIAVYQAHTYALCADTKKRHEALALTNTVIETLHATHTIMPSTRLGDVIVTVKPIALKDFVLVESNVSPHDELIFLEIESSWRLTSGLQTSARCITCMHRGAQ